MDKLTKLIEVAIIVLGLILLPTADALSQDMCEGNFDYDKDVDGTDASVFKSDFGRSQLKNPCPPDGPAPVAETGQTVVYKSNDDGYYQSGVESPTPRFTTVTLSTVKDNLTGLIWGAYATPSPMNWSDAIEYCVNTSSEPGPRLPNLRELLSLLDYGYFDPALCNTQGDGKWSYEDPFLLFATDTYYWTATTSATGSNYAWAVNIYHGVTSALSKTESHYVLCVDYRDITP